MQPELVLNEFLKRYLRDLDEGELQSLETYQGLFPGHEDLIAEEFRHRVRASQENPRSFDDARGGSRHREDGGHTVGSHSGDLSLAERLRRHFGADVDPQISLDDEGASAELLSSELVERLSAHAPTSPRYRILGEVARGGMGTILKAYDEDLRRTLAMKVATGKGRAGAEYLPTDPATLVRFLEEAQVTGQLEHPGIIPVHELGLDPEGQVYFTMRLVKGRDLGEIFDVIRDAREGWTQTRALDVILKVCEAMAYAHSKGVIHRDLKPSNVMVGRFGEVYVMDWGLAKVQGHRGSRDVGLRASEGGGLRTLRTEGAGEPRSDTPLLTMDGTAVGTPAYMPPEQARGELGRVDQRSDVYSVGAMLYHLLTGQQPYVAPGEELRGRAVLERVLQGPPASVHTLNRNVSAELEAICEKAMARDPSDRYGDITALADDLRAYLESRVVRAHRTGPLVEFKKWGQRNRRLAVTIAVALFLLSGGATMAVIALKQRVGDFRRMADVQRLQDYLDEADDELWPAYPDKVEAMKAWLKKAEDLIGRLPLHRAKLEELRGRAVSLDAETSRKMLEELPEYRQLATLQARGKPGPSPLKQFFAPGTVLSSGTAITTEYQSRGVVFESNGGTPARIFRDGNSVLEAVSQPNFLFGNDRYSDIFLGFVDPNTGVPTTATDVSVYAISVGHNQLTVTARDLLGQTLHTFVLQHLDGREGGIGNQDLLTFGSSEIATIEFVVTVGTASDPIGIDELSFTIAGNQPAVVDFDLSIPQAEERIRELQTFLAAHRTWQFEDTESQWEHDTFARLVEGLEKLGDPDPSVGAIGDVKERLKFATNVRQLSIDDHRQAWESAIASIENANECPAYERQKIRPQIGLIPIGRDPDSGLWEFAHLQSGEVPERDEHGKLVLTEATGIIFVLIPGGESYTGAIARAHSVLLDPFFLSKYEMTQGQWRRATRENPRTLDLGDLYPVESVTWTQCDRTLRRLGLTLPTEVQWEYAARAGTTTYWWTGDEKESIEGAANVADRSLGGGGPYEEWLDDGYPQTAPVGSYRANAFGLHDVIGNVWEWCRDRHGDSRAFRGGAWLYIASLGRSDNHGQNLPEDTDRDLGVRPARDIDP